MAPSIVPVASHSRTIVSSNGNIQESTINGYGSSSFMYSHNQYQPLGTNHRGISELQRIKMSLKSNIDSEIKWALSTLARNSINPYINFENDTFIAYELIKYLNKPWQIINEGNLANLDQDILTFSLDSLLTLRNLAQDIYNQQWLSQLPNFKKNLIDILKILYHWFYNKDFYNQITYNELIKFDNQFNECLVYTIDLLEPLTCYYIDNVKSDPLFNLLFKLLTFVDDKYLYVGILKCISHLLIIWDKDAKVKDEDDDEEEEESENENEGMEQDDEEMKVVNNCIDQITDVQLEKIINNLLIQDNEINNTVLEFVKMYVFSKALNENYPNSIPDSQRYRLKKLLQLKSTRSNYITLIKQLPKLIVSNLPLNEPSTTIKSIPHLNLTKRSLYSGIPTSAPDLNDELYKLILNMTEPARASAWLHCCYEPTNSAHGEVTQISIWKAYENQFEEIWNANSRRKNTNGINSNNIELQPLLAAVEFIRNVTKAFPHAEAKVITFEENGEPKKRFIIKGIQPRQFPVSIDIGKYEAIQPLHDNLFNEGNESLTIGHIDYKKFEHLLNKNLDSLLAENTKVNKEMMNSINKSSLEILDYIIKELFENELNEGNEELISIFKLYNGYWLLELIYANPSLIENKIINIEWLKYLL
ncbi:unnamed protein product [Candida verbasci]|uniref:RFX-type winged-helix domain-containing protein n=1 Tax=Candida verbasci TaxID=1227364 RepID=A0A9W4TVS4_9ASCO|nr:unnamed protein product [Candida verbasci]